jgi:hypothetical protein
MSSRCFNIVVGLDMASTCRMTINEVDEVQVERAYDNNLGDFDAFVESMLMVWWLSACVRRGCRHPDHEVGHNETAFSAISLDITKPQTVLAD